MSAHQGSSEVGTVHLVRDGGVARITFDRPAARNAMTMEMYDQFAAHLAELSAEADAAGEPGRAPLRVVVLRGAGGSFVAGTDIGYFRDFEGGDDGVAYEARIDAVADRLERLPVPTVAVVEGAAVGGGLILAAASDLRICTPDARFGAPIARTVGNGLSMANMARILAHLGPARTKALLFLAGSLGADEAMACGFVHQVADPDSLESVVDDVCARIASHAPLTLRVTKEAVRRLVQGELPDGGDLIREVYGSEDFTEGVRAFLAKERPMWKGR